MTDSSISIIMPVYNGRRFLREAVLSLLAEKLRHLQIIVVDDGSTDDSLEVIQDLPVTAIRLAVNQGIAAAQNHGLKAVTNEYVTILDCDDRLFPGGLKWRLDYLRNHPERFAVGGRPAGIIDENGQILPQHPHLTAEGFRPPEKLTLNYFRSGGMYPLLTWLFLFRTSLIEQVGQFDETLKSAHDCDYLCRALEIAEIPIQFDPVVLRRWHSQNHSQVAHGAQRELHPTTIAEVKAVCARYGIMTGNEFPLWENGYR